MKLKFWKIEYSITLIVLMSIVLLIAPANYIHSKIPEYILRWFETFDKADYMFTAMSMHADESIIKSIKNAKTDKDREFYMIQLTKPYMRLTEHEKIFKWYHPKYMNGTRVAKKDSYYFDRLYLSDNGYVVGLKDLKNSDPSHPGFIMMFDINGIKSPNTWGKDIYGINIFSDGKVTPLGANLDLNTIEQDCSVEGKGIYCSQYYRIGGNFNE